MFSKFKIEKPSHVLYKHDARHFEAEQSANILSLPLVEAYDQQIRLMRAEIERLKAKKSIDQAIMQSQVTELTLARAEAFQLRQEIQLLRDEVARSRPQVDPVKNRVKFNVTRKNFWDLGKSARSLKRKKIGEYFRNAAEKELPMEFKPTEVCLGNFFSYHFTARPRSLTTSQIVHQLSPLKRNIIFNIHRLNSTLAGKSWSFHFHRILNQNKTMMADIPVKLSSVFWRQKIRG